MKQLLYIWLICFSIFSSLEATTHTIVDGDVGALDTAISTSNTGDIIELATNGNYILTQSLYDITGKAIVINGNNATIDGNNLYKVFNISSIGGLVLNNITIQNAKNDYEASGITNSGSLTINSSSFIDNKLIAQNGMDETDTQGGFGENANGGAIYNTGILTVINTTFLGNLAQGGDGGSSIASNNSQTSYNGGDGGDAYGAAIYNDGGSVFLTSVVINNNIATAGTGGSGSDGTPAGSDGASGTQGGQLDGVEYSTLNLTNINLSEHNIKDIYLENSDGSSIDIFDGYIFSNGDINLTSTIFYDHNYSIKFKLDDNSSWWYNFNDSKLHSENDGHDGFKTTITETNNIFNIDLNNANWITNRYIHGIREQITLSQYENNSSMYKVIPFDFYSINTHLDSENNVSVKAEKIIISNDLQIIDMESKYENNILNFKSSNNENYTRDGNNVVTIYEKTTSEAIFEVKFVQDYNSTQLSELYSSKNMDINFSSEAKGYKIFEKYLVEKIELYSTVDNAESNTTYFIDNHNDTNGSWLLTNELNSSKALIFDANTTGGLLYEVNTYTKQIIDTNAGTWERINTTKSYDYRDENGTVLNGTTMDMILLNPSLIDYNFNRAIILANHDGNLYNGEYNDINDTASFIELNSYGVNDIAKILLDDNSLQLFNNTVVVYDKLFDIRKDENSYLDNDVSYNSPNQTFTLTVDKKDNNDSRAGIEVFSKYTPTTQVIADVNLSQASTKYNNSSMWATLEDVNISNSNDLGILTDTVNIQAGINIHDHGLWNWITIFDANWTEKWTFDSIVDYNSTIYYNESTSDMLNQKIQLDIKIENNKLIFEVRDENNNTIGEVREYNNSYINLDSIDKTELRARVDDERANGNGEEAGDITQLIVYDFKSLNVSTQPNVTLNLSNINLSEHNITSIYAIDSNTTEILLSDGLTDGSQTINVNITYDHNYSIRFDLSDGSSWWYNFNDNNIYSLKGDDSDFVSTINSSNNIEDINVVSSNWIDNTPKLTLKAHGGVVQFDGNKTSDLFSATISSSITDHTIEFWLNTKETTSGIIAKFDDGTNFSSIELRGDNTLLYKVSDGTNNTNGVNGINTRIIYGNTNITNGVWHHISLIFKSAYNEIIGVYVDGEDDINDFGGTTISSFSLTNPTITFNPDNNISFMLDEVRIWDIVRTNADINATINQQLDGDETGLLAYYNFDERVGDTVYDISSNGHDGTIDGNVTRLNFLGDSLSFDGIDDYIAISNSNIDINNPSAYTPTDRDDSTVMTWIYPRTLDTDPSSIFDQTDSFALTVTSTTINHSDTPYSLPLNQWSNIAVVNDNNITTVYINGKIIGGKTDGYDSSNTNTIYLGRNVAGTSTAYFDGIISDFSIWSTALSQNEIQKNMHSSLKGTETGLIGYWTLNEGSGTTIYDRSTNSNDGNITSATWTDTAPTIYGDKIYTTQNIISNYKLKPDNNTTTPTYSFWSDTAIDLDTNIGLFIHDANETTVSGYTDRSATFTMNDGGSDYDLNVGFKIYEANNNTPKLIIEQLTTKLLAHYDTNNTAVDIAISNDNKAYIVDGNGGLLVVDISDKNNLALIGTYTGDGYLSSIDIFNDDSKVIVSNNDNIFILDVSNISNITKLSEYNGNYHENVKLSKDNTKAYIMSQTYGSVRILDINNTSTPQLIGAYETTAYNHNDIEISSDGTKGYMTADYGGIVVLDIATVLDNSIDNDGNISQFDTDGTANAIVLSGDETKAYIADGENGLVILDISNPTNPTLLGSYDTDGTANDILLLDDETKVVIADGSNGLVIVDVNDSLNPKFIKSYDTDGDALDIELIKNSSQIYVADSDNGMVIVDIGMGIYLSKNFGESNIILDISDLDKNNLIVSVDINDSNIATVGAFDTTLLFNEYDDINISIPINSVQNQIGTASIGINVNDGVNSVTKRVYLKVYDTFNRLNLNLSNINLDEYNITSIYLVDLDGSETLLSDSLTNGNLILNPNIVYDHNYYIRFDLNDNSSWWYNSTDQKMYLNDNTSDDFKILLTSSNNSLTLDLSKSNWENISPTISFVYDRYKGINFSPFNIKIYLNDINKDDLVLTVTEINNSIVTISNSITNGTISNSTYQNSPLGLTISPLDTNLKGKTTVNITLSDGNITKNKRFDIVVEGAREQFNETKISLDSYNISNSNNIDTTQKIYKLVNNIYHNDTPDINKVIYTRYIFKDDILNKTQIIDTDGLVSVYNLKDLWYTTNNFNVTTLYDDIDKLNPIEELKYIGETGGTHTTYKKYLKESLKLYSDVSYHEDKFTSIDDFIIKFSYGTNQLGLVRKFDNRTDMLLIDPNNIGHLIEVDDSGNVITSDAGTWETKMVSGYQYKDENQTFIEDNIATKTLILHPSIAGYKHNIAFAVAQQRYVQYGTYNSADDTVLEEYLSSSLKETKYNRLSSNPKIRKELAYGITYLSLPSKMIVCDSSIQTVLESICNQNNTLESIFDNDAIKYVLKNTGFWSYWDKDGDIKAHYGMDKFSLISDQEGLMVKTDSLGISINLPFDETNNDTTRFVELYKNGWFLSAVNGMKTVEQVKQMVELQSKSLKYIILFRDNIWKLYAPNQNINLENNQILNTIYPSESFWIMVE